MWIVKLAFQRPYAFVVMALLIGSAAANPNEEITHRINEFLKINQMKGTQ
jgi:hypothetical protein